MKSIRAVIWDIDGTLLDSNDAHASAYQAAFEAEGLRTSYDEVRRLIGMGGDNLLPTLTGIVSDSEQGKRIGEKKKEIFKERYAPHLKPFPRSRELVQALKNKGFKLAVATSAKVEELAEFLEIIGIGDLIQKQTTSDDVESSKPDPDVIQAALKKLRLPADEVMMIGDTPYDITAATRAGVPTIAFRSGGWSDEELKGAIAIYNDAADFLVHLDSSPLFRSESRKAG